MLKNFIVENSLETVLEIIFTGFCLVIGIYSAGEAAAEGAKVIVVVFVVAVHKARKNKLEKGKTATVRAEAAKLARLRGY